MRYPRVRPRQRPEPQIVNLDNVQAMQIMYSLGDSYSRIAHSLGVSKRTVVHYVQQNAEVA